MRTAYDVEVELQIVCLHCYWRMYICMEKITLINLLELYIPVQSKIFNQLKFPYSGVLRQPTRVSYPDHSHLTFHKV